MATANRSIRATAVVCARLQESSAAPHARCGHSGHLTYRSSTVSFGRAQVTHLSPITQLGKLKPNAPTRPCVQPRWKLFKCLPHQLSIHYITFLHSCCHHSSTTSVWLLMSVAGQVARPSFFPILLY